MRVHDQIDDAIDTLRRLMDGDDEAVALRAASYVLSGALALPRGGSKPRRTRADDLTKLEVDKVLEQTKRTQQVRPHIHNDVPDTG